MGAGIGRPVAVGIDKLGENNGIREDSNQSWGSQDVPWTVYVDKIYADSDELVSMLRDTSFIPARTIGGQTNTC